MSNFIKLRLILQEPKPDLGNFLIELEKEEIKKEDLDLLLRKAVESKVAQFKDFCNALVRKGANINFYDSKDHVSNLMLACEKGNYHMVEALLQFKEINLLHVDSRQLHVGFYAVQNKSREDSDNILRLLLAKQPTLVNKEAGNQTLLIAAIRKGKVELVKLLLQAGADPNWQVPDTGNTSLHDAVKQLKSKLSKAMSEIIRLLLMKGGDSLRKNKQQKTVYEYAEKALPDYEKIVQSVEQQLRKQQDKVFVMCQLNTPQDYDLLLNEANRLFEIYEPDSEEEEAFLAEADIYLPLTEEILAFEKDCLAQHQMAQKDLKGFIAKLQKIVSPQGLLIQVYGSFATGLWVKQSNIDLQLVKRDMLVMHPLPPKELLQKIYDTLKKQPGFRSVNLINKTTRTVVIKVQIGQGSRTRNIHISMGDRNQVGKAMVMFINQQAALYPQLRPMFFVLKALSCHFKLNEPKNGGIRTYALVIMLLSCISKWNRSDLGKLLLDFLFYFGFYYDYLYECKNEDVDPIDSYSTIALQIIDPLNHTNDLGKNIRAIDLQKMFRSAYIALHTNTSNSNRLKIMFQTKKILLF